VRRAMSRPAGSGPAGAIWTSTPDNACVRIAEGGAILARIQLDRTCFATALRGSPNRRTLLIMTNQFLGSDQFDAMFARRSGQVLVTDAPSPGAGWP